MGVQMVADQDQALGRAIARMIRDSLHRARSMHGRASSGGVGGTPLAADPKGAGAAPHVFVVVGGGMSRARRLRRSGAASAPRYPPRRPMHPRQLRPSTPRPPVPRRI